MEPYPDESSPCCAGPTSDVLGAAAPGAMPEQSASQVNCSGTRILMMHSGMLGLVVDSVGASLSWRSQMALRILPLLSWLSGNSDAASDRGMVAGRWSWMDDRGGMVDAKGSLMMSRSLLDIG